MQIISFSLQGSQHNKDNINNQDSFYVEEFNSGELKSVKLVTDGCTGGRKTEMGSLLFTELYRYIEPKTVTNFEKDVDDIFLKILSLIDYKDGVRQEFLYNLLFTIVAVFELEDKFVVKFLGDGYILTESLQDGQLNYLALDFGRYPPYKIYNFIKLKKDLKGIQFENELYFNTLVFSKEIFSNIGVATDGIAPLAKKNVPGHIIEKFEEFLKTREENTTLTLEKKINRVRLLLKNCSDELYDDITLAF